MAFVSKLYSFTANGLYGLWQPSGNEACLRCTCCMGFTAETLPVYISVFIFIVYELLIVFVYVFASVSVYEYVSVFVFASCCMEFATQTPPVYNDPHLFPLIVAVSPV